jgi:hypothetical protein
MGDVARSLTATSTPGSATQYAACKAAQRTAALTITPTSEDAQRLVDCEGLDLAAGHNVPVLGDGPPLGSQEPRGVPSAIIQRVLPDPGMRGGCAPRGRGGRGRTLPTTRPIDFSDTVLQSTDQFGGRSGRPLRGHRGAALRRGRRRRGRGCGNSGLREGDILEKNNSTWLMQGLAARTPAASPARDSDGWIPPAIVPNAKSPILLRRRSPAAHAGASNYAAKIRRSFQAFLDDYEGTSANCESNKAVGQMTTAAAQWEGGLCNSGATTGGNDVRSSTWSLNEGCPVEEDMGFLTPPCS